MSPMPTRAKLDTVCQIGTPPQAGEQAMAITADVPGRFHVRIQSSESVSFLKPAPVSGKHNTPDWL